MIQTTQRFLSEWRERVGGKAPSPARLESIVRDARKIQEGRRLELRDGRLFHVPALYWRPDLDLIFVCDWRSEALYSVFSRKGWMSPEGNGKLQEGAGSHGYVPLTMHEAS